MEKNKYYLMMEDEIDNQIPEIEDDLKEFNFENMFDDMFKTEKSDDKK